MIQDIKGFKSILNSLLFSWGGDTPLEAVWTFNELIDLYCKENGVSRESIPELDEEVSNFDQIEELIK